MKNYVRDNPKMKIALDCKFMITLRWGKNNHTLKVYTNKSGERYATARQRKRKIVIASRRRDDEIFSPCG